jgi:hypothetical protein
MELSSFSENIITETFERSGETVTLKINRDALVPDYQEVVSERLKPSSERLEQLLQSHAELTTELEALQKKEAKSKKPSTIDFKSFFDRIKDIQRGIAEVKREMFAEQLTCPVALPDGSMTCILKGWDITEQGTPLLPTKENLLRMPALAVEALFEFVMSKMQSVKKRVDEEDEATLGNMPNGSKEQESPAPIM